MKAIALKRNLLIGVMLLFVVVFVAPGRGLANLDDGLVAHWNFDEGSGNILHSSVGGYNGTIYGATWASGISGSALYFDADPDRVEFSSPVLNTPPYTWCAWVKASSLGSSSCYILSNGGETSSSYGIWMDIEMGNQFSFGCFDNAGYGSGVAGVPATTDWAFLCGVWDGTYGTAKVKLYLNGSLAATGNTEHWSGGPPQNFVIGSPSTDPTSWGWLGLIDEVRIYDRALSDAEIQDLYLFYANSIGFWPNPDGWQFANVPENMWLQDWWYRFFYCFPPYPTGWCDLFQLGLLKSSDFPDWFLFASAFGDEQCYLVPPPGINGRFVPRDRAFLKWLSIKGPWPGSCFGFAVSSFLFFNGYHLDVNDEFGVSDIYQVPLTDESRVMVNKYWVYQFGRAQRVHINQEINDYINNPNANQILLECENMITAHNPSDYKILIMYNPWLQAGHAVTPYRFEIDPGFPWVTHVYVYDSNNGFPGQDNMRVSFNTSQNIWWYDGLPGWGDPDPIFLMDPISNYTTNPVLSYPNTDRARAISEKTGSLSEYVEFYFQSIDTAILQSPSGSMGHIGDSLFSTLSDGHPIIPIGGYQTSPIGYYLPNDVWTCQFSGLKDSVLRLSLFTDSTVMVYWRTDVDSTQTEKLRYPGNDSALLILNPDIESRPYNLDALCAAPDSDIYYSVRDIQAENNDSARYSIRAESRLQVDNYGGEKAYDLHIQMASSNGELFFVHEEIPLPSSSSHLIVPDWRPYNDSVMILVDSGMVGSFSDTIFVGNDFFIRGDANRDRVINVSDVVYLINYLFISGPAPVPIEAGDANCDAKISASDVVYLINYLFISGPPPCR